MVSMMIELACSIIRGLLGNSPKAAPYAKWLLRIRDYLTLLFPLDTYPALSTGDLTLQNVNVVPVLVADVKAAGVKAGFSIPGL